MSNSLNVNIFFKHVRKDAIKPEYATDGSAAADLHAYLDSDVILLPGDSVIIPTGISIELPSAHYVALIFARSGLGIKHGITLSNGVGVIDSDYRGEICIGLVNLSKKAYTIKDKDRIAQISITPVFRANFIESDELSNTKRGTGGLGSTGL